MRRPSPSRVTSPWSGTLSPLVPGLVLASSVAAAAAALAALETLALGHLLVEALVLALLAGIVVRTSLRDAGAFTRGMSFAAKHPLEVGVALLGAAVDLRQLLAAGPALAAIVIGGVCAGIAFSYAVGRALGLGGTLAALVAVGNSICGNSAIAAVAPVIRADKKDVASAIGLTAVLGVCMVIGLPLLVPALDLSHYDYGVLAGMSVYAVPQVVAAAFPVSQLSGEVATLVKLTRVLLLGPVVLFFAVVKRDSSKAAIGGPLRYVPWFVAAFLGLAALRSAGVLPAPIGGALQEASRWLTVVAMAGLGFGVELAAVRRVGIRVGAAVVVSLAFMAAFTLVALRALAV